MPQAVAYGAGVRGDEEIRCLPERAFGRKRLDGGYVERGAAEGAFFECADECFFIEERSAADVDETGAGFHESDLRRADQVPRFACFWGGDDDVVGVWQSFFELRCWHDFFGVGSVAFAGAGYAPDVHLEGAGALGEFAADGTESYN